MTRQSRVGPKVVPLLIIAGCLTDLAGAQSLQTNEQDLFQQQALAGAATQQLHSLSNIAEYLWHLIGNPLPVGAYDAPGGFHIERWLPDPIVQASRATPPSQGSEAQVPESKWLTDMLVRASFMAKEMKDIELEISIDGDLSPFNVIQRRGLDRKIIWEPISNAIKYTPPRGAIKVSFFQKAGKAVYQVQDSGMGLTEDETKNMFRDGFRGEVARTIKRVGFVGIGNGMSELQLSVKSLGGTLDVESPGRDKGTTITVRIPFGGLPSYNAHSAEPAVARPSRYYRILRRAA